MNRRTVFFVSDQTGITAETLGNSLLTQFEGTEFRLVTVPFITTVDKAREVVRRINLTAEVEGCRPIVFSTFVIDEFREILAASHGLFLDFFAAFIGPLERELETRSTHTSGRAHGISDDASYDRRIEAVNFAMANDDGITTRNYEQADVVLIGVSRSGKTPTSLYLALQYGVFAANYPLTEDELEGTQLPSPLRAHKARLYGLTIDAAELRKIRQGRRPDSRYSSAQQVGYELRQAEALFKRHGIAFVNTTHSSVEEIASHILHDKGLKRRDRS